MKKFAAFLAVCFGAIFLTLGVTTPEQTVRPIVQGIQQQIGVQPALAVNAAGFFDEFCQSPAKGNPYNGHINNDDPILLPGQQGAAHTHYFHGALNTRYDSNKDNLLAANTPPHFSNVAYGGGTTCVDSGNPLVPRIDDGSGYWVPELLDCGVSEPGATPSIAYCISHGRIMDAQDVHMYWNRTTGALAVRQPNGFATVAGKGLPPRGSIPAFPAFPDGHEWQCLQEDNLWRYDSIDNNGVKTGINEVQTVGVVGATGGTFTLTFNGQTATIDYNASISTGTSSVRARLENLPLIGVGNVSVSGGPLPNKTFKVTFQGTLGNQDVAQMTGSGASLSPAGTAVTFPNTNPGRVPGSASDGFKCGSVGGSATIRITIHFFNCWDGVNNHLANEAHVSYDVNGTCPNDGPGGNPDYPVVIPKIAFQEDYTLPAGYAGVGHFYRLALVAPPTDSAGSTNTAHADQLVVWDTTPIPPDGLDSLATLVAKCVNAPSTPLPAGCNVNPG